MLSVVIPAYNEDAAIGSVVGEVRSALEAVDWPWEVLVVDDGSSDRTASLAKSAGARVVSHPYNMGGGAARKTGVLAARYGVVCVLDGDGTYPANAILELVKRLSDGNRRLVVGSRGCEAGTLPWLRGPVKSVLGWLASRLARRKIPDLNSGMMLFRADDARKLLHLLPDRHSWVTAFGLGFHLLGWPVEYVDIGYRPRIGTSSFRPVVDTFLALVQLVCTATHLSPLRLYIPIFVWGLGLGSVLAVHDLWNRGTLEESDIIVFILSGTALAIGLLADSVARLHRRDLL